VQHLRRGLRCQALAAAATSARRSGRKISAISKVRFAGCQGIFTHSWYGSKGQGP
jgi:hypothetical protein